jgi:hypothetical protein
MKDDPTDQTPAGGIGEEPGAGVAVGAWALAEKQAAEVDRRPRRDLMAAATTALAPRDA